jgi:GH15 family glucan-1,4-alpha-glucosidase
MREATFDAWELWAGKTFHSLNLARRALRAAAIAGTAAGHPRASHYANAAERLERALDDFYDERRGHVVAIRQSLMPWVETLSGLDGAVVGSVLAAYDVADPVFNVDDPRIRATLSALEHHYRSRWPVNARWAAAEHTGVGFGRFPEDMNDGFGSTGGNPWPIVTLWAAQFHLRSIERDNHLGTPDLRAERLARARDQLAFVLAHSPVEALSEQIDAHTGRPRGARRLAWAHAELVVTLVTLGRLEHWRTGLAVI